jgi:hypothetical protein
LQRVGVRSIFSRQRTRHQLQRESRRSGGRTRALEGCGGRRLKRRSVGLPSDDIQTLDRQ